MFSSTVMVSPDPRRRGLLLAKVHASSPRSAETGTRSHHAALAILSFSETEWRFDCALPFTGAVLRPPTRR